MLTSIIIILAIVFFWLIAKRKSKPYNELLKSQEWKDKREKILERDNHKCCWCGSTENLQVHHKYYSKYPDNTFVKPWDYPDDALITLCSKCHKKAHATKKIKVYYRKCNL